MSFDTCVFLIGLILIVIVLVAFLPFLFWEDPVEDNNSNDLKVGDRVAFGGRPYDIWIVESIDKENNWCVVISDKYPKAKYGGYIDIWQKWKVRD